MIEPKAVLEAAQIIAGQAHKTPVLSSRALDDLVGARLFFKCENFQRVGAFKFRGAYYAVSRLSAAEKAAGVITHSSGNHAQGLALAANLLGVSATVVMPRDAPANKRAATEGYGASIVSCDAIDREDVTRQLIDEHGHTLVHPFDNDNIIAGQGTAALELLDEVGALDFLLVPVGGGGLISGCAMAAALRGSQTRVVGVEPAIADDANRSWRSREIQTLPAVPPTLADGLRTRAIGERNLAVMTRYVSDMTTVSEEAILEALGLIWSRLKIVVEPSAAVALAPLISGAYAVPPGANVGVLLSGGNIDTTLLTRVLAYDTSEANRHSVPFAPARQSEQHRPRVLVAGTLGDAAVELLELEAEVVPAEVPQVADLLDQISGFEALIVGPDHRVDSEILKYGHRLKAIGTLNSRLDHVEVSSARAMGIEVVSAPDGRALTIAEHTVARLLALADRFGDGQLSGKTLGIIGFGTIGRMVAERATAFQMRVLVNQPRLTPELALSAGTEVVDLPDLLTQSDFVSLHLPYRSETEAVIGPDELDRMRPAAMLLNSGYTELVDESALLSALDNRTLAGASLPELPEHVATTQTALAVRAHPSVIVAPHVTALLDRHLQDAGREVARQIAAILRQRGQGELLDLVVVPVEQVVPHEHIDHKRVDRLMGRLEDDGRLVNPPVTTRWQDLYVILDGATRYGALKELGYSYVVVQVVNQASSGLQLYTWYHAISAENVEGRQTFDDLYAQLASLPGVRLVAGDATGARAALEAPETLNYFISNDGRYVIAQSDGTTSRLAAMNALVDTYNAWGRVERTLLTDVDRLRVQFPSLLAVAVFPQFAPDEVFDAAVRRELLPAGLTRFVIPGRVLRLNADLKRLKRNEPLADKRAWFDQFIAEKLLRSRLRYYQEPVVLLDE